MECSHYSNSILTPILILYFFYFIKFFHFMCAEYSFLFVISFQFFPPLVSSRSTHHFPPLIRKQKFYLIKYSITNKNEHIGRGPKRLKEKVFRKGNKINIDLGFYRFALPGIPYEQKTRRCTHTQKHTRHTVTWLEMLKRERQKGGRSGETVIKKVWKTVRKYVR